MRSIPNSLVAGDKATILSREGKSASARRAQRLMLAQALSDADFDWTVLNTCPMWLTFSAQQLDRLAVHAGAWWFAASLRACIDGKRLAKAAELIGKDSMNSLFSISDNSPLAQLLPKAPRPSLPAVQDIHRHFLLAGQALLAWSLPDAARTFIAAQRGWSTDTRNHEHFVAHGDWANHALQVAIDSINHETLNAQPDDTTVDEVPLGSPQTVKTDAPQNSQPVDSGDNDKADIT